MPHRDTDRLADALAYATEAHEGVMRTGTTLPYIIHPVAVMELVRNHGGDTNQQIAALLHDVVEDAGGIDRLTDIEARFGPDVAALVLACTDHVEAPDTRRPGWWERKARYIEGLHREDPRAALVTTADKVHNSSSILANYREEGETLWERFSTGRVGQLWYYDQLAAILPERVGRLGASGAALGAKLQGVVGDIVSEVKHNLGVGAVAMGFAQAHRNAASFEAERGVGGRSAS